MKCPHFAELVFVQAEKYKEKAALWFKNEKTSAWQPISWNEFANQVKYTAKAMLDLGVESKQNIAIFSQNKPESFVVDFAAFVFQGVCVPLYATSTKEQVEYIINDATIETIFVGEQYQYDIAYEVMKTSEFLKRIIYFDEKIKAHKEDNIIYFQDLLQQGEATYGDFDIKQYQQKATEDDLASILYTSGTTGDPKGVMLAHYNYLEVMRIHDVRLTSMTDKDKSIAFLPITHVFERAWSYLCLFKGVEVYVNLRPQDVQQTIKEVQPTLLCAVPRFWEKVYIEVKDRLSNYTPLMLGVITWALVVGKKYNVDNLRLEKKPNWWLALRYKIADKLIFSKVKKTLGIENGNFFPVAGAPLSDDILEFFRSIGIPLVYGYGLTESTATVSCFTYTKYEFGTIGAIMPDIEVKIGEDNEILLKGKTITQGYYKRPELNKIAFTEDGFFRTGDAGNVVNNQIVLTERIKDLFKTSNGKYIAPQQIEIRLTTDRFISQVAVIADQRNYVTALIVPDIAALKKYAEESLIEYTSIDELLVHPSIIEFYMDKIKLLQKGMASFEQIKKFTLIKQGFSLETGELTNTLKLRRTVIGQKNKAIIDKMYEK